MIRLVVFSCLLLLFLPTFQKSRKFDVSSSGALRGLGSASRALGVILPPPPLELLPAFEKSHPRVRLPSWLPVALAGCAGQTSSSSSSSSWRKKPPPLGRPASQKPGRGSGESGCAIGGRSSSNNRVMWQAGRPRARGQKRRALAVSHPPGHGSRARRGF